MGNFNFAQVPVADIPRSSFNRSHGYKTTFDAGYLIPFYCDEALPGDTFNVKASLFARLATPIVPIMDNLYMDVFFFAVPNRLLWDKWQRFMGEQLNPGDSIDFLVPQVQPPAGGWVVGTLPDYFGLPTGIASGTPAADAFHFRAYNMIWNEWFRDENLQTRTTVPINDGPDISTQYVLKRRGKRHDYFTSCLPWPQKGAGVTLPLGTTAPVFGDGTNFKLRGFSTGPQGIAATAANPSALVGLTNNLVQGGVRFGTKAELADTPTSLYADLSTASAATINSLRQAFQIQKLLERDARGGTRYVELLRSHFGVVSPDARVQRPEFLGGGTVQVIINPVVQNSSTDATTPQGHLAAFGTAAGHRIGFVKSFVEHCTILGMLMVRGDLSYQQGQRRMWDRRTRYDFYWPAFAHLGEQAVLNKEIYCDGSANDALVFGYQERWAEYKYFPSMITGKFRSTYATPLDSWHLAQKFTSLPTLGATFIEENPPMARVLAVATEPQFILDSHISIQAARPMPTWSVPGLMDHF